MFFISENVAECYFQNLIVVVIVFTSYQSECYTQCRMQGVLVFEVGEFYSVLSRKSCNSLMDAVFLSKEWINNYKLFVDKNESACSDD